MGAIIADFFWWRKTNSHFPATNSNATLESTACR